MEIAIYIGTCMFNEGTASLLYYIGVMSLSFEPNMHLYNKKGGCRALDHPRLKSSCWHIEKRMVCRQHQIRLLEAAKEIEG